MLPSPTDSALYLLSSPEPDDDEVSVLPQTPMSITPSSALASASPSASDPNPESSSDSDSTPDSESDSIVVVEDEQHELQRGYSPFIPSDDEGLGPWLGYPRHSDDRGKDTTRPVELGRGHHGRFYSMCEIDKERLDWQQRCILWHGVDMDHPQYNIKHTLSLRLERLIEAGFVWWKGIKNDEKRWYLRELKWKDHDEVQEYRKLHPGPSRVAVAVADDSDDSDCVPFKGKDEDIDPDPKVGFVGDPFLTDPKRFVHLPRPPPTVTQREDLFVQENPAAVAEQLRNEACNANAEAGPSRPKKRARSTSPSPSSPIPSFKLEGDGSRGSSGPQRSHRSNSIKNEQHGDIYDEEEPLLPELPELDGLDNHLGLSISPEPLSRKVKGKRRASGSSDEGEDWELEPKEKGKARSTDDLHHRASSSRRHLFRNRQQAGRASVPRRTNVKPIGSRPDFVSLYRRRRRNIDTRSKRSRSAVEVMKLVDSYCDPAQNEFHETYLYNLFSLPLPTMKRDRVTFRIQGFYLSSRCRGNHIDLLELDESNRRNFNDLKFGGLASPLDMAEKSDGNSDRDSNDSNEQERNSIVEHEVIISATDLLGLEPRLDECEGSLRPCLFLLTENAVYRLENPSSQYQGGSMFERARVFLTLFVFGHDQCVLGQNGQDLKVLVEDFVTKLGDAERVKSSEEALASIPPEYVLDDPISSYANVFRRDVRKNPRLSLAYLLHRHLPNAPFVTPNIYRIIAPHLDKRTIRTNFSAALEKRMQANAAADEAAVRQVKGALMDWRSQANNLRVELRGDYVIRKETEHFRDVKIYYEARIGRETYRAGDTILVIGTPTADARKKQLDNIFNHQNEHDDDKNEEADWLEDADTLSQNNTDEDGSVVPWYAKIVYFYKDSKDPAKAKVHLSFYVALQETPIGKCASPRALVHQFTCSSEPLDSIVKKLKITELSPRSGVAPLDGFYVALYWDTDTSAYTDLPPKDDKADKGATLYKQCEKLKISLCSVCEHNYTNQQFLDEENSDFPTWLKSSNPIPAFQIGKHRYHLGDYVYLVPPAERCENSRYIDHRDPYELGRLVAIDGWSSEDYASGRVFDDTTEVMIELIARFDESEEQADPRQVLLHEYKDLQSDSTATPHHWSQLEGTWRLETWSEVTARAIRACPSLVKASFHKSEPVQFALALLERCADVFYVKGTPEDLAVTSTRCPTCDREFLEKLTQSERVDFKLSSQPEHYECKVLAPYAGVDLLGEGLSRGCSAISNQTAIEMNSYAADSLRVNKKDVVVYNYATSEFIEALVLDKPLRMLGSDVDSKIDLEPGNVHVISSGPPCQGFSQSNLHRTSKDTRCLEPFVFLSLVDFYRPLYVVFENVSDIQRFILPSKSAVKGGLVRLLMNAMMELGYQIRLDIYNAASFGTPQTRRRVIITAARRGLTLPAAAQPTHAFTDFGLATPTALYEHGTFLHSSKSSYRRYGLAPHRATTIEAAISDLPSFGFVDPFGVAEPRPGHTAWAEGEPLVSTSDGPTRGRASLSAFQRASRLKLNPDGTFEFTSVATDHAVPPVSKERAAIFANVGVAPDDGYGDYRDVPETVIETFVEGRNVDKVEILLRPKKPPKMTEKQEADFWARTTWDQVLTTMTTQMQPDGYWRGRRIHPRDARQISVREALRLQGVHDDYRVHVESVLDPVVAFTEKYKAIGNGVPIQLGEAIGREFNRSIATSIILNNEELAPGENAFSLVWEQLEAADQLAKIEHGLIEPKLVPDAPPSPELAAPLLYQIEEVAETEKTEAAVASTSNRPGFYPTPSISTDRAASQDVKKPVSSSWIRSAGSGSTSTTSSGPRRKEGKKAQFEIVIPQRK